eukprot:95183-Chlamydomonas_euryale.AAC.1
MSQAWFCPAVPQPLQAPCCPSAATAALLSLSRYRRPAVPRLLQAPRCPSAAAGAREHHMHVVRSTLERCPQHLGA